MIIIFDVTRITFRVSARKKDSILSALLPSKTLSTVAKPHSVRAVEFIAYKKSAPISNKIGSLVA